MIQLRDYQGDSVVQLRRNFLAGSIAQILQMATGGGKTAVASHIGQSVVQKGGRFYFVVDSIELIDQAYRRFTLDGMQCGVIQGQHPNTNYSHPVQIATIQTLGRRWPQIADHLMPSVLVIDECHVFHAAHRKIVDHCKANGIPVIGLSATPFRKGLGEVFDKLVVGATTAELTRLGYLVPARCFAPYIPDLKGVKNSGGDWQADDLAEVMGTAKIVGDVVDHWLRHARGRKTLVFAANVAHSKHLREAFRARGIAADHIDGYERDPEERERKIEAFRSGETEVLCNVAVLTKGFDVPEVSCVVLARPTKSLMLHIQMLGRGLRIAPGKEDCLILDHAGNVLRNGMPTDPLPQELDDGTLEHSLDRRQREKDKPVDRACSACGFVSSLHRCPACGFAPERREDVEVRDGHLVEITANPEENLQAKRHASLTNEQRGDFYAELLGLAGERGYREGWAAHQYRNYFGKWPNDHKHRKPRVPGDTVRNWVLSEWIRNSKRRKAA